MEIIKRTVYEKYIQEALKNCISKKWEWKTVKTICVLKGFTGSGKTTCVLNYFKNKNAFYFSFAGLIEDIAEKVFADYVTEKTGDIVCGWENSFAAVSKKYKVILFDDISSVLSSERFCKAFYDYMITNINTRPFVVIITQMTDDITGLADKYKEINFDYFTIPETIKLFPTLSKFDILGLCTVSGGISKIMSEYNSQISLDENLRNFLKSSSTFCNFMPEILLQYFRKPESYHYIFYAIANGNHSVSEIGKFTGFAYNKCDNYLSVLVSCGFLKTEKALSKRGAEKTVYVLTNNYFRLWYLYVYRNRTEIQLANQELIGNIINNITNKEIHKYHLQKAFLHVNKKEFTGLFARSRISEKITYTPETIRKGNFSYTFDAIFKNEYKAVFVKVFADPLETCRKAEIEKIRRAIKIADKHYENYIYIFSKRRFSDYAVAQAAKNYSISLVEVDRLRF